MYFTNPRPKTWIVNAITNERAGNQGSSSLLRFAHHAYRYKPSVTLQEREITYVVKCGAFLMQQLVLPIESFVRTPHIMIRWSGPR